MQVVILIGSGSDGPKMLPAKKLLDDLGIECEMRITSAHRTPERTVAIVDESENAGCQVFICGAGMAAHLAGAVAAQTTKPVIGVPLTSSASPLGGKDALLATVQMPSGIPVATVAIDGAKNAAWLAAQILALSDWNIVVKLHAAREAAARGIVEADGKLQAELGGEAG